MSQRTSRSQDIVNRGHTRFLGQEPNAAPMPPRGTHPLDLHTPRMIRLVMSEMSAVIEIPVDRYLVMGRMDDEDDQPVDIDLSPFAAQEFGVSRYHAVIQVEHGRVSIKDVKSTNGTFLNDFMLEALHTYRLRHGDELRLGGLKMRIFFVGTKENNH